jgi:myosin heavy subunit
MDEGQDQNTAQLRQLLREKNEKITILTSEFDAHRADFRSTLDSLEMASTETERVYEEQKRDLIAQVQDLSDRMQEMEEMSESRKDFEDVANQLKGLEEFVQELEEGLEDARRGEAEARGEVEFLRGEVERGRSELKREREKASQAVNGHRASKDLEERDNEIRGLKEIIHRFSTSPEDAPIAASNLEELTKLKNALKESQAEKERLEMELEQLRRDTATNNGHPQDQSPAPTHNRNESELTAIASRPRADTSFKSTFAEHARSKGLESEKSVSPRTSGVTKATTEVYCEMCESSDHDTLECNTFQTASSGNGRDSNSNSNYSADEEGAPLQARPAKLDTSKLKPGSDAVPAPLSPKLGKKGNFSGEAEKETAKKPETKDSEKWCALCEKDGHLAYECPDEQY